MNKGAKKPTHYLGNKQEFDVSSDDFLVISQYEKHYILRYSYYDLNCALIYIT